MYLDCMSLSVDQRIDMIKKSHENIYFTFDETVLGNSKQKVYRRDKVGFRFLTRKLWYQLGLESSSEFN